MVLGPQKVEDQARVLRAEGFSQILLENFMCSRPRLSVDKGLNKGYNINGGYVGYKEMSFSRINRGPSGMG